MADETSPNAGADAAEDPLLRLSIRTKALVVANEYTHRQMEPNELARVLAALAPTAEERAQVARAVEEELRAARYPLGEIVRLMGELVMRDGEPRGKQEPVPEPEPEPEPQPVVAPANEQVLRTQKVRAPHLMPFERYEFQAPDAETPGPPGPPAEKEAPDVPAPEPPPPTQKMPIDDAVKAVATLESWAQDRAAPGTKQGAAEPAAASAPEVKEAAPQASGFSIDRSKGVAKPEAGGPRPVVLVADDDARARVMYRMKLEQSGFTVREAKDGIEAWKQIRTGEIEFLVTDMKMPGYHGLEILGRMLDAGMTTPVVVVSAFDQLENEFVVSTYPKLKFLAKPASPESVAAAVGVFAREAGKQTK